MDSKPGRFAVVGNIIEVITNILNGSQKIDRNLVYTGIGNFGAAAAAIVFWIVITNLLNVNEYGFFNYVISIAVLLSFSSMIGLITFLTTFLAKGKAEVRNPAKTLMVVTSAVAAIIAFGLQISNSLILLVPAVAILELVVAELLGDKRYKLYSIVFIVHKFSQSVVAILFFFLYGIEGLLIGYGLGYLVVLPIFLKGFRLSNPLPLLSTNWKFLMHGYSMSMVNVIVLFSDKLVIAPLFGFHALGLYQFGSQVLTFAGILPTIFFNYLLPHKSAGNKTSLHTFAIAASAIFSAIFIVLIPIIVELIFPKFIESIFAAQIIIIGVIPMTITYLIYSTFLAQGKSSYVLIGSIIFVAVQYPLIYIFGSYFGIVGMSIATVTALSVQCAFIVMASEREKNALRTSSNPS